MEGEPEGESSKSSEWEFAEMVPAVRRWRRFVVVASSSSSSSSSSPFVLVVGRRSRLWLRARLVRKLMSLAGNLMNYCKLFSEEDGRRRTTTTATTTTTTAAATTK